MKNTTHVGYFYALTHTYAAMLCQLDNQLGCLFQSPFAIFGERS